MTTKLQRYLRLWDIIGSSKRGIEPLYPVSRSTWLAGVKSGRYPKPFKLGQRVTAWRSEDIAALTDGEVEK